MVAKLPPEVLHAAHNSLVRHGVLPLAVVAGTDAMRAIQSPHVEAARKLDSTLPKARLQNAKEFEAALTGHVLGWIQLRKARFERQPHVSTQGLRERAAVSVKNAVHLAWATTEYRHTTSCWAGGDHTVTVNIGGLIGVVGGSTRVWSANKKWSGTDSAHVVSVRLGWRSRVERRGIAVVDGLFTCDVQPWGERLEAGEEALSAWWVAQGRGFNLTIVHGILYRVGDKWIHAPNLTAARRVAKRAA